MSNSIPGTTADLTEWVAERIDESGISDETGLLILAALEGDRQLDELLAGVDRPGGAAREAAVTPAGERGGIFLTSLEVEGFRGIGPATPLPLRPEPGLTIVAGRNGSGKSSLSEALELTLTGDTYRWTGKKSTQWRDKWRNMHHPRAQIAARFVEEGGEPLTVTVDWADDETDVLRHRIRTQRHRRKQEDGRESLGWEADLSRFRPILSYDELGAMLSGAPSDLHDAVSRVLGLEQFKHALDRLQVRHKESKAPGDALTKRRKDLVADVAELDDDRATPVHVALRKTNPDVAQLRALTTGTRPDGSDPLAPLRKLSELTAPATADTARAVAKRLRTADAELAELESGADTPEPASTHLLEQALRLHTEHGDQDCPVCGTGRLDAAWAHAAQEAVRTDRQRSAQRKQATDDLELARIEAWGLLVRRPAALDEAPAELAEKVDSARTAWDAWTDRLRGRATVAALELADHLESRVEPLTAAIDDLREAAATELTAREDVWQPVRGRVLAWCEEWQAWLAAKPTVDRLGEAKKWLQDNDLQLRNDRLAPIRDGARQAWARLRQESNVEIGDLSLVGSATQRKLRIDSRIDGVEAGGLTVLSQGELHALALALFLPRATMAESPFRFLVLDDPVQAMDPAKVDGLVALLTELAQHRQVIVLSHDDRLPAAVRRGTFAATILEVNRGKDSQVSLSLLTDPAQRYLADAFALVKEHDRERVPAEALHRTLPGLLRFAVEAAARHTYFTRNLSCGRPLAELEREWEAADRTRRRVSLALFDDPSAEQQLENWSRAPYRKDALHTVGSKMHRGLGPGSDPQQAARAVERLIADLNAAAR